MNAARKKGEAGQGRASAGQAEVEAETRSTAKCPICGKPRDDAYRPFCSKRCADVDLGRWLHGSYAIPVTEDADEDGETASAPTSEAKAPREPDDD
jgi:uncharacterized protein